MTHTLSREQRCAVLAEAEPDALTALADACLADGVDVRVLIAPEVGCVTVQVREPVGAERFLLGDVLACRAEVELGGHRGWAMRLGDDRAATLAAAVLDAELQAGRPHSGDIEELCRRTIADRDRREAQEWAELAPTIVQFEVLT